ncbi:MAG TPA: hypothetical protein VHQ22_07865 [Terriglobales bacterium]|nr:hypothetical protein [Terriglobales bacterium]
MESQNQNPLTTKPLHGGDTEDTEKKRIRQRAEALVRRIGETCDELDRLAEENPELVGGVTRGAEEHKDAYVRLKARLQLADAAPRCRWVRQDGTSCESPQMKKHIYCFAHRQMMEARALVLSLPAPEDANAIQIGIMRIQKALIEGTVSTKTAGLLLYSMQLALQNVGQTTFGQAKTQELVMTTVDEEEAIRQDLFTTEDTENTEEEKSQNQKQRPLTAKDAEDAKEYEGIGSGDSVIARDPRQGGRGRVIGNNGGIERPKPVEWKPTPDMYRTDTPEGREAYEACLRMTTEPRLDG